MICWAIGRMIASSFHWMRGICFGWIFPPWALLFGFLGLAPQGLASSSVVHRLCTIWMHARSRTLIPSVLFGAGISTVSSLENFHVMMRSRVALLMLSRDAQPIRSLRACASDWTYDPLVLWITSWNWLSTFSKWDLIEIEYFVRDVAASNFHDSSPPFCLYVSIHTSLKVRPSSCRLLDVYHWMLTPVAGRIFETKNRAIFLERFFGRGISGEALLVYNVVLINWLWSGFIYPRIRTFVEKRFHGLFSKKKRS